MQPAILDEYQRQAAAWVSRRRRGAVVSPAGSGKTVIAAAALHMAVTARRRDKVVLCGWIANTEEQCAQAAKAVRQRATPMLAVKIRCAQAEEDWGEFDVLVVDEAHHAVSNQWASQIATCRGAVWGFTATPPEEDEEAVRAFTRTFQEVYTVPRAAVSGRTVPGEVRVIEGASDPGNAAWIDHAIASKSWRMRFMPGLSDSEIRMRAGWLACMEVGIEENRARNDAAVAAAVRHKDNQVLVIVGKREHGSALAARIPGAVLLTSKLRKTSRRASVEDFKAGRLKCLVATSLADEGLDVPCADVLVLVCGGRTRSRTEQRTGRVLRKHEGKDLGVIYDFADVHHRMMEKHWERRLELYRQLGYAVRWQDEWKGGNRNG